MAQSRSRVRFDRWGYIFVTPFVLTFLLFQLYPIINTFYLSFTNMKGASLEHQLVGLDNFSRASESLKLTGLPADQARTLSAALNEAGFQVYTDVPEEEVAAGDDPFSLGDSESSDPFALDLTETAPEGMSMADESAYDLGGEASDQPVTYYVEVDQLDAAALAKAKDILKAQGVSDEQIQASVSTVFAGLIFDQKFWQAFGNTALLFFLNFVPQLFFALVFAVWFTDVSLKIRMGGFFKTIFYLPNIITAASIAVLFASLFGYPSGPINQMTVQTFNLPEAINFFRSEIWTRGIVAFIQFWMWYGTTIIVLSAGILGISPALFESAVVDGARPGQVFTRITLPLLRPIMTYTLVTSLIGGLQMFDIPYLLTNRRGDPNGSINTTAIYLYNQAFSSANNYSYAATISIGMFLLILVLAGVLFGMLRNQDDDLVRKVRK